MGSASIDYNATMLSTEKNQRVSESSKIRRRPISSTRRRVFTLFTVICSTVLTYYFCEAIYRILWYRKIINAEFFPDVVTDAPMDRFNEKTGFSYIPNTRTRYLKYKSGERLPIDKVIRINNMGHISWHDDQLDKPESEYRIAVLGDSFTAALEMHKPWPDILEELLNRDDHLKEVVGVSSFNVINFGQDGIGLIQCADIHRYEVSRYKADLVILNFITEDVVRRYVYRDTVKRNLEDFKYQIEVHTFSLPCTLKNAVCFLGTVSLDISDFETAEKRKRLKQDVADLQLRRTHWFSAYPELLASRIGYRFGLRPRLFGPQGYTQFHNPETGLKLGLEACRRIKQTSKDSLFLFIPIVTPWELTQSPRNLKIMYALAAELRATNMERYLPRVSDAMETDRWFIPDDGHFSDYGGTIYAQAVHKKLKVHLAPDKKSARDSEHLDGTR